MLCDILYRLYHSSLPNITNLFCNRQYTNLFLLFPPSQTSLCFYKLIKLLQTVPTSTPSFWKTYRKLIALPLTVRKVLTLETPSKNVK